MTAPGTTETIPGTGPRFHEGHRHERRPLYRDRRGPRDRRNPLTVEEICNDDEGYSRTWRLAKRFPEQEQYALCR